KQFSEILEPKEAATDGLMVDVAPRRRTQWAAQVTKRRRFKPDLHRWFDGGCHGVHQRRNNRAIAATKLSAPIPARAFNPSRSLFGRMSVGVRKRSDSELTAIQTAASPRVR